MAALPYIQLYVADYLADTMHLTAEEHGAYLLLIFNYWQTGKPIPKSRLQSITRVPNERWTDVEQTLNEFFNDTGTHWQHDRIDEDLRKVNDKQSSASKAGKASAAARKAKKLTKEQRKGNERSTDVENPLERKHNHTDTDTDTDNTSSGDESPNTPEKPSPTKSKKYPDWFESLWNAYPPRAGSNDKRRAFQAANARLKEGKTLEDLQAAVFRYSRFVNVTGKQHTEFVKQAATFFGPGEHIDNPWRIPDATHQPNHAPSHRESLAERSWRESEEILTDLERREAGDGPLAADASVVRPQVDQPDGARKIG